MSACYIPNSMELFRSARVKRLHLITIKPYGAFIVTASRGKALQHTRAPAVASIPIESFAITVKSIKTNLLFCFPQYAG